MAESVRFELTEGFLLRGASSALVSTTHPTLQRFNYSIRLGLLWTGCPNEPWFITHYSYYKIKPDSLHASIEYITAEMVEWAKNKNMKLYYYTVNSLSSLQKAKSLHADGIFSDYPNLLK